MNGRACCLRVTFVGGVADKASMWVPNERSVVYWPHPTTDPLAYDGPIDKAIVVDVYERMHVPNLFGYMRTEQR